MLHHDQPLLLKNQTSSELYSALAPLGVRERDARRLQAAVVRGGASEIPSSMSEISPRVLASVAEAARVPHLELLEQRTSNVDGFTRLLFRGEGGEPFETVRIPIVHRPGHEKYVVCVSSQVGCALACDFCATGRLGFRRNLATWEIVDQVVQVQRLSTHPVTGVVFMGMGEPMLNYDNVMRAAAIFSEPCGMAISAKAITISTVGVVPMIRRFTEEKLRYRLVVSLTSADSASRAGLLPVEHTWPLPQLMAAVRDYHASSGRRITLAWTLIRGFNTSEQDARQLAELTAGLPIKLDLIDVNDATGRYQPPDDAERNRFRDALRKELGMPVARRYSGGQDVNGGCGMLAGSGRENPAAAN